MIKKISIAYILLVAFLSIFAYFFIPDKSTNANQMHLSIHSKSPGFKVDLLLIENSINYKQTIFEKLFFGNKNSPTEIPLQNFEIDKNIFYYNEYGDFSDEFNNSIEIDNEFQNNNIINRVFLLGTDKFGRDVLSRLVIGARISFFIGFISVLISLIIGVILGSLSGYYSGNIDRIIMWIINVTWSIPTLLLVIAITLALGKGLWQVFIAVGLTMWVDVARVVRGQVMTIKERQFITAARVLGFSDLRILTKHILPNIVSPLIIISAANFAASILIESGLSFLGLGAQPPMASWGSIIKDHYNYIILGKPMLALIPGICIMSLVMAFMLLGNKLRDKLDVKN
ncbi:ABC transporter permease [Flavobacteriaceae bacterium]|nr:ABC transporter permease [Flavobacteriaceae bacterium]MDA9284773.1 ABC transporter permease [Flavobacteriaceae bacterium]MDC0552376.1 ABC transporter permease [Flavobacteriaceae bacterium]